MHLRHAVKSPHELTTLSDDDVLALDVWRSGRNCTHIPSLAAREPDYSRAHHGALCAGHCRAIETKLKTGAPWKQIRPEFERLNIAASDGHGKQPRKIPGLFFNFIQRNVATVSTEKDFLSGFLPHFEALVGFGSLYLSRERN